MSSRLYLQLNSPLRTVFENPSPQGSAENQKRLEELRRAPHKLYRKPPSNLRRPQPVRLDLSAITRTPSALLHNDWYLNQLFNEVQDLYRPGALTGYPIRYSLESSGRHLSLLRDLAPGCRITPLFPSLLRSPERIRSAPTLRLSDRVLSDRTSEFLLSHMPPKRKGVASSSNPKASNKRATGRKEPLDNEKHVFSAKSKLMNEDLTQFFASPLAWSSLTEEEKEEIRTLLPHDIPYDESGAPSQEYLRYDNDWRESLRLFSEDVQMGRYEPEWLEEAQAAAEARRRGDYDQWKDDQFEEFWGQKSDAHADLIAGKALQIRLGEMVEAGVFHVGDVFSYARSFGHGGNAYLVEKDLTIVEISDRTLSFTAASGTRKKPTTFDGLHAADVEQQSRPKRRIQSDETKTQDKLLSESLLQQKRRSNSVQSSQNSAPSSRPGTSGADYADEDARANKKRFGILKSFRRSSSPTENELGSGGLFNLRRKPVPKMEIVPASATVHQESDSDSPLSSLSGDEDMDLPAPWEVVKEPKRQAILRKLSIDKFARSRSTTPTGAASQQTSFSRRPLPSRPSSQSKTNISRPPTSGSAASSDSGQPSRQPPRRITSKKSKQTVAAAEKIDAYTDEGHDPVDPNTDVLVSVTGIDSLHALEQKVLEIDGRRKGEPRANAWRTFHCRRGKLDLGSLAEMREEYYKAKHN